VFRLIETHPRAELNRGFAENRFELTDEVKTGQRGRLCGVIDGDLRIPCAPQLVTGSAQSNKSVLGQHPGLYLVFGMMKQFLRIRAKTTVRLRMIAGIGVQRV